MVKRKKKFIVIIMVVLLLIILLFIYLLKSQSVIYHDLSDKEYNIITKSTSELNKYNLGDSFFLAEQEDLNELTDYNDQPVKVGNLYVWHNYGNDDSSIDIIGDRSIKSVLKLDFIDQIDKKEKYLNYRGINSFLDSDDGFWGFYYAFDSKPQPVYFEGSKLVKDNNGWKIDFIDGQRFYTESVKDGLYYYKGKKLP